MRFAEVVNAVLALLVELALLAAGITVGLHLDAPPPLAIGAAVLLPAIVVAVWSLALAPRAARRLRPRGRLLVQAGLAALAVLGLAAVGLVPWAFALTAAVAARLVLGARIGRI